MDSKQTLVEHLSELRARIGISLVSLVLASGLGFSFVSPLLAFLKVPSAGLIDKLVFFSPQEAVMIYMRIAFLVGLVISMPVILYQLWLFVRPAMEERLKRHAAYFVFFSTLAFICGCVFAYSIIIPPALKFCLSFSSSELVPMISADKYISFVIGLTIGTGLVFQMPVLSFILTKLNLISASLLRRKYRFAIVGILVTAAIITPTSDVFNMLVLAGPMLFLYELSIWVSFFAANKPSQKLLENDAKI